MESAGWHERPANRRSPCGIRAAGPRGLHRTRLPLGRASGAIFGPTGATLAGPHSGAEERLVIADINLDDIARQKVLLDTAGHYSRPEVLRLVVDRRPLAGLEEQ